MINVNIEKLTEAENVNKYSLVTAVAKRARVIADQGKIDEEPLFDRPVSTSFDELADGKYRIVAKDPGAVQDED